MAGLMQPSSHSRCHLGPGARKGLLLVRRSEARYAGETDEVVVERIGDELRQSPALQWIRPIDVEQALCEYFKYDTYVTTGVSAGKRFIPSG